MQERIEFWIVSYESNGQRKLHQEALNAIQAREMAKRLSLAGMRGRTRRFQVAESDVWQVIDKQKRELIAR